MCGSSPELVALQAQVGDEALASIPAGVDALSPATVLAVQVAVRDAAGAALLACHDAALAASPAGTEVAVLANALDRYRGGPEVAVQSFGRGVTTPWTDASAGLELLAYGKRIERSGQAYRIQTNPGISLATAHPSGERDDAMAADNIQDVVEGNDVDRSAYGNAPGGTHPLADEVLTALETLGRTYRFHVSEIAGASHSRTSRHYSGEAIDISRINGQAVSSRHPDVTAFMTALRDLGASVVYGPGDSGHDHHVHAQW